MPAAAVHGHGHQLVDDLVPAPDLGDGLELPVGGEGDDGLDLEQGPRRGGDLADAPALHQILQGVHGEEGEGAGNQLWSPALHQGLPVHAVSDVLRQLEHRQPLAQGAADRVEDPDGEAFPALLGDEAHQIVGAGKTTGEHNGQDAVVAGILNFLEYRAHALHRGQGGLGQLAGPEAAVDVGVADVDAVGILAVGAEDAQGDQMNTVFRCQLRGQIRTGIR